MSNEADLRLLIGETSRDPLKHVLRAYPWGEGALAGLSGPRAWQSDVLEEIGRQLRSGAGSSRALPIRIAVASGHGVGKSALMAWIVHWAWSSFEDSRVVITANTGPQLKTKTWPEVTKWFNLLLCRHWFQLAATSIQAKDPAHRQTWRVDQVTWTAENTEAFAGLHNLGRRIVVLFDEASTIDDKVWEVTEGALTDEGTEIVWIAFGNPTRNSGRFRECWGRHRGLWTRRQIDSRTVPGTNRALFDQWIESYGEDSDFVRVRVKGEFPRAGSTQFIDGERVEAAAARPAEAHAWQAMVLGVDVARFGDDQTVIAARRGLDARTVAPKKYRGLDTMQVAARVMEAQRETGAIAVFVDEGGVGAGVVDRLRQLRCPGLIGINFGARADRLSLEPGSPKFANKRAEMWGSLKDWLKQGAIADDSDLRQDLTAVEYGYNIRDEIQLESKDDMKARGLASPDLGDALALTFAHPVADVTRDAAMGAGGSVTMLRDDWEPYRE